MGITPGTERLFCILYDVTFVNFLFNWWPELVVQKHGIIGTFFRMQIS